MLKHLFMHNIFLLYMFILYNVSGDSIPVCRILVTESLDESQPCPRLDLVFMTLVWILCDGCIEMTVTPLSISDIWWI